MTSTPPTSSKKTWIVCLLLCGLNLLAAPLLTLWTFSRISGSKQTESPLDYINVKRFGAKGDGVTDDAPAIEAAVKACYDAGGGTVYLPPGTYLLGTLSKDANAQYSYIVPRDRVSIRGAGMGATILKVKAGENPRLSTYNGPNVICTAQPRPLTNCVFSDFTVDWDGTHNLLKSTYTKRTNASILSLHGGTNVVCERIHCKETPGNNCIVFSAVADQGQRSVTIRDCLFSNNGSGLAGNHNKDHSSIYLNGSHNRISNCRFTASQKVQGACFELHGSDSLAEGCKGENYYMGFYLVANYEASDNLTVRDCQFTEVWGAFNYSANTYAVNNSTVDNCSFKMADGASYIKGQAFVDTSSRSAVCDKLTVTNCRFLGLNKANCRALHFDRIADVFLTNNYFENFIAAGIGPRGSDLGTGRCFDNCLVSGNIFRDLIEPIKFNTPLVSFGNLLVLGNQCFKSVSSADVAIQVYAKSGIGRVADNTISTNYTGEPGGITTTVPTLLVRSKD